MAWLTSIFYFGFVENGFLLWRFYALDGGVFYEWVCSGGDIVFAVAVDNCLIVFIVLFIILGTVVVNSVLGGDRSCVTKGFIIYLLYIFRI